MKQPAIVNNPGSNPFDLRATGAYKDWRAQKLAACPRSAAELVVEIRDPRQVSRAEKAAVAQRIGQANMAVFALAQPLDKPVFAAFCAQFGLRRLDRNLCADDDGISALHVVPDGRAHEYIPYSNKPINWHTDGYYNAPDRLIRAMVLHCVQPAAQGGANALLDPEIAYIHLRDLDPGYISALMHPQCMTIPPNVENGVEIRAAQSGPVFSLHPADGSLHMRYTARTRSIAWRDDPRTREAIAALEGLLNSDSPHILLHRMEAGQGVLCNNVLHTRTGFADNAATGEERLVLRARYYDRIDTEATTA